LTFYPLGNADSYLIALESGKHLLVDYGNVRDPKNKDDLRIDLPVALREALGSTSAFDVVIFTHTDRDHVQGASEFFELRHAKKYQGDGRVTIEDMWVPAAFIIDTKFDNEDAPILQREARYRLREGQGIRIFGRPETLKAWLEGEGLSFNERRACLVDAGRLVPGFTREQQGVEFFAHSPFAVHQDAEIIDKNRNCIVLQATFDVDGQATRLILGADAPREALNEIVQVTKTHGNGERLQWDIFKLPHHCSYLSLSDEKGKDITSPDQDIKWLFEQGQPSAILVSTSDPIPDNDDSDQPPHRQAANYYRSRKDAIKGDFVVTMEHPSRLRPEPLVITIGDTGGTVKRTRVTSAAYLSSRPAPRAG
jgi:hypothetical protein